MFLSDLTNFYDTRIRNIEYQKKISGWRGVKDHHGLLVLRRKFEKETKSWKNFGNKNSEKREEGKLVSFMKS